MGQRFLNPYPQFLDSTPAVYSGGLLYFYASGTSSLLDTYSNEALSVANTNPVVLNSAGRPAVAIFLSNVAYKVVLKDSSGSEIWTIDPYYGTDFKSVTVTKVGSGSPTGSVAGTAGSSGGNSSGDSTGNSGGIDFGDASGGNSGGSAGSER